MSPNTTPSESPSGSMTKSAAKSAKSVSICTHIKVTGIQCGSPALRGKVLCYFHQRMTNFVSITDSRIHHAALLENEESIQASIMELVNSLLRGTMEIKRGEIILRALNTAVRNSRRVRFGANVDKMVRETPSQEILEAQIADTKAAQAAEEAEAARQAELIAESRRRRDEAYAANRQAAANQTPNTTGAPSLSRPVRQGGEVDGDVDAKVPHETKVEPSTQTKAVPKNPTPEGRGPAPGSRKPPQSARVVRTPPSAQAATKAS